MADVQHKYTPRPYFNAFHARTQRFAVLVVHRRGGKTVAVLNDMVVRAMRTKKKNWFGAYVCPFMGQSKQNSWAYIKHAVSNLPAGSYKIHESEVSITFANGAKIRVFGSDNADALRGLYFDMVVLDEVAQMPRRVWTEVIRPALADRRGTAVFMSTPRGKNFFWELAERARNSKGKWFFQQLTVDDTKILPESELAEIRKDLDDAEFNQEFMVSFDAALVGSYYGRYLTDLIKNNKVVPEVLFKPGLPVSVSVDIGFRDACAIWFWQINNGFVNFIEYMEETEKDADEIIQLLHFKPYDYSTIWLPHDAFHKTFQSKKSVFDTFTEHQLPVRRAPNPDAGNRVFHGIDAVRKVLRTYPLRFAARQCAMGLEALKNYSREVNAKTLQYSDTPKHDRWSHGADSFRYACLSIQLEDIRRSIEVDPFDFEQQRLRDINRRATLDDLLASHDSRLQQQRTARRPRI